MLHTHKVGSEEPSAAVDGVQENRSLPSASPGAEQRWPWPGGTLPPLGQPAQPAVQRAGPRGRTWPAGPAGRGPS